MAFITYSFQNGPNGIIVVDLASGESWRRLNNHPSTKSEDIKTFLPIVEGRPFLDYHQQQNGKIKHGATMGADGIAINADGSRLYYCPFVSATVNRDNNFIWKLPLPSINSSSHLSKALDKISSYLSIQI